MGAPDILASAIRSWKRHYRPGPPRRTSGDEIDSTQQLVRPLAEFCVRSSSQKYGGRTTKCWVRSNYIIKAPQKNYIAVFYQNKPHWDSPALSSRVNHHPPCHPDEDQELRWMMSHALEILKHCDSYRNQDDTMRSSRNESILYFILEY